MGYPRLRSVIPEVVESLPIPARLMNHPTPPPLITREQLAVALGICRMTVSRLTALGRIPFVSVGRRGKRYDREAVVVALSAYINAQAKPSDQ